MVQWFTYLFDEDEDDDDDGALFEFKRLSSVGNVI
jgi:hypothetical protein